MIYLVTNSKNSGVELFAQSAPAEWKRVEIGEPVPEEELKIVLCEENTLNLLPEIKGQKAAVVFDSVRKPIGFFEQFDFPVFSTDAPAPGLDWLWTAVPLGYYDDYDKNWGKRDINALFIGKGAYRPLLRDLRKIGVTVIETDKERLTYSEYVRLLFRSRCVVNLCADRKTGKPQTKGRIYEALFAGAVLLEEKNPLTIRKIPVDCFATWQNVNELKSKIAWRFPDTAEQGQKLAWSVFLPEHFWSIVGNSCGLSSTQTAPGIN